MPNETWQSDFTHYRLASGTDVEVISWLDDCSRYALHVTAHGRVTGPIVTAAFRAACRAHGVPASTLTDNGMVFTARFAGGRGGRNTFERELRRLAWPRKTRPAHPPNQGKVERFQQTMKKWLRAQPVQPTRLPNSRPSSMPSSTTTTPAARTAPSRPGHPGSPLRNQAQSPARRPLSRYPRPRPPRPHRQHRARHPPPQRPPPPHRHRPSLRGDLRHPARPGPPDPRHQRHHRRTPPRTGPEPQQRLPAHRPPTRLAKEKHRGPYAGSRCPDVLRHHSGGRCWVRTNVG